MKKEEFLKIENLDYFEYCKYLQTKYGIPSAPYFTENFNRVQRIARTNEGLFIHHIKEDSAVMLSNPNFAKDNPYEYQLPQNLVYCDYLEHMQLHILICKKSLEYPEKFKESFELVSYGGLFNVLIPDLNDIFSGYISKTPWRRVMAEKVVNDLDSYLLIMDRFMCYYCVPLKIDLDLLTSSSHAEKETWDINNNADLNKALEMIYDRNIRINKKYMNGITIDTINNSKKKSYKINFEIYIIVLILIIAIFGLIYLYSIF